MKSYTAKPLSVFENYKRAVLLGSMLVFFAFPSFSQVRKITINASKKFQEIESFTASDAWSGNFVGKYWNEKQKEQIAEWLFSQQYDISGNPEGIALSMWRVNLGAGTLEQDSADIMPVQRRAESFLAGDGPSYDWGKCAGQQYFMQKATEYGCNNFLLFSNSPLVQYTKNGKGWSYSDNEANIKPDCYSKYAAYLADVSQYFEEKKAWHIAYISPVNEPQVKWNKPAQEGSPWKSSEMKSLFVELDKALSTNYLADVKILVGESAGLDYLYETSAFLTERFSKSDAPDNQIKTFFDPQSSNYIGDLKHIAPVISGHSYRSDKTNEDLKATREKVKNETEKYGISFHQTEWCMLPGLKLPIDGFTSDWQPDNYSGIQPALLLGRLIYGDFVYAGAKSWGYWKGMEVNGNHALVSLFPADGDLKKGGFVRTNKLLWALGNYSFFIRPGYIRIDLQGADDLDTLVASAYLAPDNSRIVAVYVNSSFEMLPVNISFLHGWNEKAQKVSIYKTDDRTDLANMVVAEKFLPDAEYLIPPRSLVTMVFYAQPDSSEGKYSIKLIKNEKEPISRYLMGFNLEYPYEADEIWQDGKIEGYLKDVNASVMRYPGGTLATFYHWDALTGEGWKDSWDPEHPIVPKANSEFMNLDEYISLTRRSVFTPLLGINMSSGRRWNRTEDGIKEAIALMQYCRDNNFKVKYWYLDNEPYQHDSNGGSKTIEEYAGLVNLFANRMRAFDPDIKIIVNWRSAFKNERENYKKLLDIAGANIDMVDAHWYWSWNKPTFEKWLEKTPMEVWSGDSYVNEIAYFRQMVKDFGYPNIQLASLEWNVGPIRENQLLPHQTALIQSEMMMQFMAGGLDMAALWPLQGPWASVASRSFVRRADKTAQPAYQIFKFLGKMQGKSILKSEIEHSCPNLLNLVATDEKEGSVRVCLLNKNAVRTSINIGSDIFRNLKLIGADAFVLTNQGKGSAIQTVKLSGQTISGISFVVPPTSVTMLTFEKKR